MARQPGLWILSGAWIRIGLQSFGGGVSTLVLIERTVVTQRGWLDHEELGRSLNLSLLAPGPNLIALTILIGYKLRGGPGIAASLIGLLLPSALITCLLTAGAQAVQHMAVVQAMLAGIVPATGGLLFVVVIKQNVPLLRRSWKKGWSKFLGSLLLGGAAVLASALWNISVMLILCAAAFVGTGLFSGWLPQRNEPAAKEER